MYHRLLRGGRFVGMAFTFEARQLYMSQLHFAEQRQVLWDPISPYDSQPSEDEIVDKEEIEIMLGLKTVTFN